MGRWDRQRVPFLSNGWIVDNAVHGSSRSSKPDLFLKHTVILPKNSYRRLMSGSVRTPQDRENRKGDNNGVINDIKSMNYRHLANEVLDVDVAFGAVVISVNS